MLEFARENPGSLLLALLLHGVLFGAFFVTIPSQPKMPMAALPAVDSVVVDPEQLLKPMREQAAAERRAREREAAEERRRVQTEQRQERERVERERRAEDARQAEVQRREEAERLRLEQAEAERKRRQEAERLRREEAEKKRLEEIERKRQEAEAAKRREAEARAQAQREAELQRQLAEEEGRRRAEDAGLLNQYIAMIQQRVIRNWNRPESARPGLRCEVDVVQAPGGTVLSVDIGACNGDAIVRQSIEAAVLRASPLPPPPDPRLFERNVRFIFEPKD